MMIGVASFEQQAADPGVGEIRSPYSLILPFLTPPSEVAFVSSIRAQSMVTWQSLLPLVSMDWLTNIALF